MMVYMYRQVQISSLSVHGSYLYRINSLGTSVDGQTAVNNINGVVFFGPYFNNTF